MQAIVAGTSDTSRLMDPATAQSISNLAFYGAMAMAFSPKRFLMHLEMLGWNLFGLGYLGIIFGSLLFVVSTVWCKVRI